MNRLTLIFCTTALMLSCATLRPDFRELKLVESKDYNNFEKEGYIVVQTIDGKVDEFVHLRIIEVTDTYFVVEGLRKESSQFERLEYKSSDTVIGFRKVSGGRIANYFIGIGILVALILIYENNKVTN